MAIAPQAVERLDASEVDKLVGQEVGGGQLKEPIAVTDIRRWVQSMNYPNRRHFDETVAAGSPFGEIVAPQSFTVCCDVGNGMVPAVVGRIPASHVIFGGDEWWFYGPCIRPGDLIRMKRRFDGYSIAETKFAGPTMFSRGDTTYYNQRTEVIAKQRSTAVRYRPDLARARGYHQRSEQVPTFTGAQLRDIRRQRAEWFESGVTGKGPGKVSVGDKLPIRPIGPHTIASFVTEYRALIFSVWGSHYMEGKYYGGDAGWLPELVGAEGDGSDPAMVIGVDQGPASGHTDLAKAQLIGFPRAYGYGSVMGTWVLDYVAYWAGDRGFIRHSKVEYRSPVFEGDLAILEGEVTDFHFERLLGVKLASIDVRMVN